MTVAWPAPAKLNLFLHVTGRRPDGYHELQTVFQFLDFGDTLRFRLRGDGEIRRAGELPGVAPGTDLAERAARRLQAEAGTGLGADIDLEKRIPMGGGLGGGSSDAATTLVALDRLWGTDLGPGRLARIGLALGADVPVFVLGHAAWAEGIGERLTPVDLDEPWYLVLTPDCHASTAEVFGAAELTRNTPPVKIRDFLRGGCGTIAARELLARARNDCEPVARGRFPPIDEALAWLERFGPARMTGTGASVFAPFAERSEALRVLGQKPGQWRGFVARGRNVSPLVSAGAPGD